MHFLGGSSRIPTVQKKVEEFFGKVPSKDVNPSVVGMCCTIRMMTN